MLVVSDSQDCMANEQNLYDDEEHKEVPKSDVGYDIKVHSESYEWQTAKNRRHFPYLFRLEEETVGS